MTRRIVVLAISLAVFTGAALGSLFPTPVHATPVWYTVNVHPGGNHDYLTCGWHGECATPTSGSGIDFRNFGEQSSYWRSWTYRTDTSVLLDVGTVDVYNSTGVCKQVSADLTDNEGASRGGVRYVHQKNAGDDFTVKGKDLGEWQTFYVSQTIKDKDDELSTCPGVNSEEFGPHLHMHNIGVFDPNTGSGGWPNAINAGTHEATDETSKRVYQSQWMYDQ